MEGALPSCSVGASGEGHVGCVGQESMMLLSKPGPAGGGDTVCEWGRLCD